MANIRSDILQMSIIKRSRPRIEPCGTPHSYSIIVDILRSVSQITFKPLQQDTSDAVCI